MKSWTLTKRTVLAAGLFVLLGASLPTKCSPALSTGTLTGEVTAATHRDVDDANWPQCPLYYPLQGPDDPGTPGDREVWTARIDAKDPDTRLFIAACLGYTGKAWQSIDESPFVIDNRWGRVRGTAWGVLDFDHWEDGGERPYFRFALNITKGSGAYRDASEGRLWYQGCLDVPWDDVEEESIYGAAVVKTAPDDFPRAPACANRRF